MINFALEPLIFKVVKMRKIGSIVRKPILFRCIQLKFRHTQKNSKKIEKKKRNKEKFSIFILLPQLELGFYFYFPTFD